MSKNNQLRLSVINNSIDRRITRPEAAQLLDTTERTVTRMANKIRRQGIAGIKHGNSGKTPANDISSKRIYSKLLGKKQHYRCT